MAYRNNDFAYLNKDMGFGIKWNNSLAIYRVLESGDCFWEILCVDPRYDISRVSLHKQYEDKVNIVCNLDDFEKIYYSSFQSPTSSIFKESDVILIPCADFFYLRKNAVPLKSKVKEYVESNSISIEEQRQQLIDDFNDEMERLDERRKWVKEFDEKFSSIAVDG